MSEIQAQLEMVDWQHIQQQLAQKGYVVVPKIFSSAQCQATAELFSSTSIFRKIVIMARHRFGLGEYKYFAYPLPSEIQTMRQKLYQKLAPMANQWMQQLNIERQFPGDLTDLHRRCYNAGQELPTPLILKYEQGGFNTLHQDLYGEVYFPLQAAIMLSQPNSDFFGGEFVLTEQVPRAQSKATVLSPNRGDMIIFTTQFRPIKGSRGYFRAQIKHGVSEVRHGTRYTLGIIFHDALR